VVSDGQLPRHCNLVNIPGHLWCKPSTCLTETVVHNQRQCSGDVRCCRVELE